MTDFDTFEPAPNGGFKLAIIDGHESAKAKGCGPSGDLIAEIRISPVEAMLFIKKLLPVVATMPTQQYSGTSP